MTAKKKTTKKKVALCACGKPGTGSVKYSLIVNRKKKSMNKRVCNDCMSGAMREFTDALWSGLQAAGEVSK